jgi:hypothetical protein
MGRALSAASMQEIQAFLQAEKDLAKVQVTVERPSNYALRLTALNNGLPFIGFGFIDNSVMIIAGDIIDVHLGVTLGISTLASAALGNMFSDQLGIGLGGVVEALCVKLGLPTARLSRAQEELRVVKFAEHMGALIGITIGCILGMFPLLFLDTDEGMKQRNAEDIEKYLDAISAKLETLPARTTQADLSSMEMDLPHYHSHDLAEV